MGAVCCLLQGASAASCHCLTMLGSHQALTFSVGWSSCPRSGCCPSAARTTSGRWGTRGPAGPAARSTTTASAAAMLRALSTRTTPTSWRSGTSSSSRCGDHSPAQQFPMATTESLSVLVAVRGQALKSFCPVLPRSTITVSLTLRSGCVDAIHSIVIWVRTRPHDGSCSAHAMRPARPAGGLVGIPCISLVLHCSLTGKRMAP